MKKLVLGMIGGSEGNGHPFSWSAIFNGYEPKEMLRSGYPLISEYLGKEKWPEARIKSANVDYVYAPDPVLSSKIAAASRVKNIASNVDDMLQRVDALLLARDDAENHLHFAKSFLQAGLPVLVDKPVALNWTKLEELFSFQTYVGQIFSCSALSYAEELQSHNPRLNSIGHINSLVAETPNSWQKYGVHIVEPIIKYLNGFHSLEVMKNPKSYKGNVAVSFINNNGVSIDLKCHGEGSGGDLKFTFLGSEGEIIITPKNYFYYFKNCLSRFMNNIHRPEMIWETSLNHHKKVVSILEFGH